MYGFLRQTRMRLYGNFTAANHYMSTNYDIIITGGGPIGIACALGLTHLMSTLFFGISPYDPITLASVSALLIAVAFLACLIPARRAAAVDPMIALRAD